MDPVKSRKMLNFIHWVAIHKKDIKNLKHFSKDELLGLVQEYEGRYISQEDREAWMWDSGFRMLLESESDYDGYDRVRNELLRSGLG